MNGGIDLVETINLVFYSIERVELEIIELFFNLSFCEGLTIWLYGNFRYLYQRKLSGLYRRERLYDSAISRNCKEQDEKNEWNVGCSIGIKFFFCHNLLSFLIVKRVVVDVTRPKELVDITR